MRALLPIALLIAFPAATFAQETEAPVRDELAIEGIGLSRDIPCNGQNVGIYGSDNQIALTGDCGEVVVHGANHKVSIEAADALLVTGAENTVTVDEVAKISVDTATNVVNATLKSESGDAVVEVYGAEHTLNLTIASKAAIEIQGTENVVNWHAIDGAPDPRFNVGGIDNAVNNGE